MRKISLLFLTFLLFRVLLSTEIDTVYVLHTTDVHGNLLAYDYYKDQPAQRGLVKLATFLENFRSEHRNVLLLDGGDMIQGTPLAYLYNRVETASDHPLIEAMNYLGYSAMAVGNHEIEQGLPTCDRLRKESRFSWLSANSILANGKTYFEPYKIIEIAGLRIAVFGLTTPGIPKWLDPEVYQGIDWQDMVEISRNYIAELRAQADIVIGLFHAGLEPDAPYPGLPQENASGLVAAQVPGFDLILGGHSHQVFPESLVSIVDTSIPLQLISGSHGRYVGVVQLLVEKTDDTTRILKKSGWVESLQDYSVSQEMEKMFEKNHNRTLEFIRRQVAVTEAELTTYNAYFSDNPLIDMINNIQLEITGADLSFASCFNRDLKISSGPVMVKDIYTIYPYENFLYTIEMSGAEIDAYLEYAARFFRLEDDELQIDPDIAGYNYDIAEGIEYTIDLKYPIGSRINGISLLSTGELLQEDKLYSVALNSFRGSGGGGFLTAIGMNTPEIIYRSDQEIRNMIIEYLATHENYEFEINHNWQILK